MALLWPAAALPWTVAALVFASLVLPARRRWQRFQAAGRRLQAGHEALTCGLALAAALVCALVAFLTATGRFA